MSAAPPSTMIAGSPARSTRAAASIAASSTVATGGAGSGAATTPPSLHEASEGRIRVATWPGGVSAACTAWAARPPTSAGVVAVRTQPDTPRAKPSVSAASSGSSGL